MPVEPPTYLYYGAPVGDLFSVLRYGLPQNPVHLSADTDTAIQMMTTSGSARVFKIDAGLMFRKGHQFYVSDDGIWTTNAVPPVYIC